MSMEQRAWSFGQSSGGVVIFIEMAIPHQLLPLFEKPPAWNAEGCGHGAEGRERRAEREKWIPCDLAPLRFDSEIK